MDIPLVAVRDGKRRIQTIQNAQNVSKPNLKAFTLMLYNSLLFCNLKGHLDENRSKFETQKYSLI
jgi:hypothetical protein